LDWLMRGKIDLVTPEGLVEGWGWNELAPDEKLDVILLLDGVDVGGTRAMLYRDDLRKANIGDGFHAFSFVLQTSVPSKERAQTFELVEATTRMPIGEPIVVYNKPALDFDDRLSELEAKGRLLEARLREVGQHDRYGSSPAELFSVVGAFFTKLARDVADDLPLGLNQGLNSILLSTVKAYPQISFSVPTQPAMTIIVHASAPLPQLHACLSALHRAGTSDLARIIVLDPGIFDDAALIPSITRGLRYIRTIADLTSECIEADHAECLDIVVLMTGRAIVAEGWAQAIVASFAHDETVAAVGGYAIDQDGRISHAGLSLTGDGVLIDEASVQQNDNVDGAAAHKVHALSHQAVAIRRSALMAVGGLDPAYGDDLGATIIDICFRLSRAGWSVMAQPRATMTLLPSHVGEVWITPAVTAQSRAGFLLRSRWLMPRGAIIDSAATVDQVIPDLAELGPAT
jgi:hypothetical protein